MLKYVEFEYKGGDVLKQLKEELDIVEISTCGKTYYTKIGNVNYEIIDYGFCKYDKNMIFVEIIPKENDFKRF